MALRVQTIVGAVLGAAIAGLSVAQEAPQWVKRPTADQLSAAYPLKAMAAGLSGRTVITCTVMASGMVKDCTPILETPAGYEFGAAAVSLAPLFQMKPPRDGKIEGATVSIPVNFSCDDNCKMTPVEAAISSQTLFTHVPWNAAPTFEQWSQAWPKRAKDEGMSGHVNLRCKFAAQGKLTACVVLKETPLKADFAVAARRLTPLFQGPVDVGGKPTRGALVDLAISFERDALGRGRGTAAPPIVLTVGDAQIMAAYPAAARAENITFGQAQVACTLAADGIPGSCAVRSETPPGKGFGSAALTLAPQLRFGVWTHDGQPVSQLVTIPFSFGIPPRGEESFALLRANAEKALSERRYEDAIEIRKSLQARFPDNFEARTLAGRIINALPPEMWGKAFTEGAEKSSSLSRLEAGRQLNALCWTKAVEKQLAPAMVACNSALELVPDHPQFLDSRGFTYLQLGEFSKAVADYDAALATRPNAPTSLYGRGIAKLRSGDTRGGNLDLVAARRLSQNIDEQFARYGVTRTRGGGLDRQ